MRIAHLSAEVSPLAKTGGLGDVAGALPIAQAELGHEVSVWMPLYRQVRGELDRRKIQTEWVLDPIELDLGFRRYQVGFLRAFLPGSLVPLFLVGSDEHFDRPQIYSPHPDGHDDGLVRYAVFVRAAMEAMRRLHLVPDVLHAHDWHTALAPMAVAWERDWHFDRTATVQTIHNAAYQGIYAPEAFVHLGLPGETLSDWGARWRGAVNLLKGGVLAADAITAVSPTFAHEITTPDGGFGLDPVLRFRGPDLHGIVNGIDPRVWNPRTDPKIPARYDDSDFSGKLACRRVLLERAGMDPEDRGFVVGVVSRLTSQKGLDLLFPVLGSLMDAGIRFVVLGSGDDPLEDALRHFSAHARGRFWGYVGFSDDLAHLIEAGADAFLMPSRFEPCGLNQLYSLAYGTPPIVRRTGGLADTVVSFDGANATGATGFGFDAPTPDAVRDTITWAASCYRDPYLWTQIMKNGMRQDWSWTRSARTYLSVYEQVLGRKRR